MGERARFLLAVLLACAAFASQASAQRGGKGGGDPAHMLNAAEAREALEGRVICIEPRGRLCDTAYVIEEITDTNQRGREYSLDRIADWSSGPAAEFIQSTAAYRTHEPLFREIAALQHAGGYDMVKMNSAGQATYDPGRNAWCGSSDPAHPLNETSLYFTRTDRADSAADAPLPLALMERFRAFLIALVQDPVVRARIADDPDMQEGIESSLGMTPLCVSYVGLRRNGRMTVTEIVYSTPRAALRSWRTPVDVRDAADIVLSADHD